MEICPEGFIEPIWIWVSGQWGSIFGGGNTYRFFFILRLLRFLIFLILCSLAVPWLFPGCSLLVTIAVTVFIVRLVIFPIHYRYDRVMAVTFDGKILHVF